MPRSRRQEFEMLAEKWWRQGNVHGLLRVSIEVIRLESLGTDRDVVRTRHARSHG